MLKFDYMQNTDPDGEAAIVASTLTSQDFSPLLDAVESYEGLRNDLPGYSLYKDTEVSAVLETLRATQQDSSVGRRAVEMPIGLASLALAAAMIEFDNLVADSEDAQEIARVCARLGGAINPNFALQVLEPTAG